MSREARVPRVGDGLDLVATLQTGPEIREIVIAQGKEFRNGDSQVPWVIPQVLQLPGKERRAILLKRFPDAFGPRSLQSLRSMESIPLLQVGPAKYEYLSLKQGVLFTIEVINTKDQFVAALKRKGVHLIYAGHARYGRGPCFGAGGDSPGDDWEDGSGPHPNSTGIFRMGYPFIAIPVEEILHHEYHARLVSIDTRLSSEDCDPDMRPFIRSMPAGTLDQIDPRLAPYVVGADPEKRYWCYDHRRERHVVLFAGWNDTSSKPDDLGSFDPECRVFSHFGCSSMKHNHKVLRHLKSWRRAGNERYAYFTTNLSDLLTDVYWLQALLTYSKPNAYLSWRDSLEYAVRITNRWLSNDQRGYAVI